MRNSLTHFYIIAGILIVTFRLLQVLPCHFPGDPELSKSFTPYSFPSRDSAKEERGTCFGFSSRKRPVSGRWPRDGKNSDGGGGGGGGGGRYSPSRVN